MSYKEQHKNSQGPGDARPTASQIIRDANAENKLVGKFILITGVSSGIGAETAKALIATGATIVGTARNVVKAQNLLPIRVIEMNNNSFASIRAAVSDLPRVDILINNAGVNLFQNPSTLTEDGFDVTYQTNYLSQMYLYKLLKPTKIINVASSAHKAGNLDFTDHGNLYANTKLASVYMANKLSRRPGTIATSVHPGNVGGTEMGRHAPPEFVSQLLANKTVIPTFKSVEQGAASIVLATIKDFNGKYVEDCGEAEQGEDNGDIWVPGFVPRTYNQQAEEELWKSAERQLGNDAI